MLSARRRSSSSTKTVSVARRRCIIVSLSRGGVSRRWCSVACLHPGGWGGVRDWMSVGKKTHAIGTKNVFLFLFAKKKTTKKKGKREIFYDPNVFSTPNTKARRTTNQKTTTGQKRERTTTFRTRIIERAAETSARATTRVVVSRLFFVGEIFQFRIGSRVKSKKEEQRGERRRDGQRSSRASTREGALRFPVFFCDSSSARIEEDDRRCRASDRRGTFLKCHAKMCSVINQSVPPNDIQKRRDGCKRLTYATRVFFGLLNILLRAGHERSGRVRLRFFHR